MIEEMITIALIKGALDKSLIEIQCDGDEESSFLAMKLQWWAHKELDMDVCLFDILNQK